MATGLVIALEAVALGIAALFESNTSGTILLGHFRIAFATVGVTALITILDVLGVTFSATDDVRCNRNACGDPDPHTALSEAGSAAPSPATGRHGLPEISAVQ